MAFRIQNNKIIPDTQIFSKTNDGQVMHNTDFEKLRQELLNPSHQNVDGLRIYDTELQYATLLNLIDKSFPFPTNNNSVSISNNVVAFGIPDLDASATGGAPNTGGVEVYEWTDSSWTQRGTTIVGNTAAGDTGWSVDLSSDGNTMIIGSWRDRNEMGVETGSIQVYEWDGSSWIEKGDIIYGPTGTGNAGRSVSLSHDGNIIAFGTPRIIDDSSVRTGGVDVYEWNGSSWVIRGNTVYGTTLSGSSGSSVSMSSDGNIFAVGALRENNSQGVDTGSVSVYKWNGSSWVSKGTPIYGSITLEFVGQSVSLSPDGNILAFGSTRSINESGIMSGSVRIYKWNGSSWVQKGLAIYGSEVNALTGQSVNISPDGNTVAFGSTGDKNESGAVVGSTSMYVWSGSMWIHKTTIYGNDENKPAGNGVSLTDGGNILASSGQDGNVKRVL